VRTSTPSSGAHREPLKSLRHLLPIIRWHHEKLDGTGYPDGLKGSQFPVPSRSCSSPTSSMRSPPTGPTTGRAHRASANRVPARQANKGWRTTSCALDRAGGRDAEPGPDARTRTFRRRRRPSAVAHGVEPVSGKAVGRRLRRRRAVVHVDEDRVGSAGTADLEGVDDVQIGLAGPPAAPDPSEEDARIVRSIGAMRVPTEPRDWSAARRRRGSGGAAR